MKMTRRIYLIAIMLISMISIDFLPFMSYSDVSAVDSSKTASLTLTYQTGGEVLKGVFVKAYRVGDMTGNVVFKFSGDFARYDGTVDLKNVDSQAKWKAVARTLSAYVVADRIGAIQTKQSDSNGVVAFDQVRSTGLYLIVAEPLVSGSKTYSFEPFMITMPNKLSGGGTSTGGNNNWNYDVVAYPKSDMTQTPTGGGGGGGGVIVTNNEYKAVKNWMDQGATDKRPQTVTIEIFKNGESYKTETLSSANNWSYSWQWANDGTSWQVVERNLVEPYTVTVVQSGNAFVITNTYTKQIVTEEVPNSGVTPTPPSIPGQMIEDGPTPTGGEEIENQPVPRSTALPQTGQLWWPVPWLICLGLMMYVVGWSMRRIG